MKLARSFAFALLALGCSAKTSSSPPPIPDSGVPAGSSFTLSFGPLTVNPTEEHTRCIVKRLGNIGPIHVGTIHNVLSQGSHHMIAYRTNDTVEQPDPFACNAFTDTLDPTKGSTLMVTQKHDDTLNLPDGVAYTLDANQMIRLEVHFLNPGSTPLTVTADSTFVSMDDATYKNEADFLFIGTPDIKLPPNAHTTTGPIFFQVPPDYEGVNFFAITGHQHQYGTNVSVTLASSKTDPGTPFYDVPGWLWSEPKTVVASPAFQLPSGGGFRFTCEWNNTSSQTVKFGESANNEMCFFWAYYYPSRGARVCIHSEQVQGGVDICCPGPSLYCALLRSGK